MHLWWAKCECSKDECIYAFISFSIFGSWFRIQCDFSAHLLISRECLCLIRICNCHERIYFLWNQMNEMYWITLTAIFKGKCLVVTVLSNAFCHIKSKMLKKQQNTLAFIFETNPIYLIGQQFKWKCWRLKKRTHAWKTVNLCWFIQKYSTLKYIICPTVGSSVCCDQLTLKCPNFVKRSSF